MLHVEQNHDTADDADTVRTFAAARGLILAEAEMTKLSEFVVLLLRWNEKHNLISRADTGGIWIRHILHSLSPLMFLRLPADVRFVDIGTGGGLPGLPLAIVRPDYRGVLIESIAKKAAALSSIVSELAQTNVSVLHARAEDPKAPVYLGRWCDVVLARAVAPLAELAGWSLRLLKREKNGHAEHTPSLIAWKGGDVAKEVDALHRRYPLAAVELVDLDFSPFEHMEEKKLIVVKFSGEQ